MYFVRTQSEVNDMNLHHNGESHFESESLADALRVFEKEVTQLEKEYINYNKLDYTPCDRSMRHSVFCEITTINEDDDLETIKISDNYFEK